MNNLKQRIEKVCSFIDSAKLAKESLNNQKYYCDVCLPKKEYLQLIDILIEQSAIIELLAYIAEEVSMQNLENFEDIRDSANTALHQIYCDICGDFHNVDNVPISCETGDGE